MDYNSNSVTHLSPEYVMGGYTAVDNIFICEYLKSCSEIEVKVYLFGLYLAHSGVDSNVSTFTSFLSIEEDEVVSAFLKLQEWGVVDVTRTNPLSVNYQPISNSPIKRRKIVEGKYDDFNKELQNIMAGRMISVNEYMECYNLIELYHLQPEAFLLIASYCVKTKGKNITLRYVTATAKNFAYKNITTLKGVEEELSAYELQTSEVASIIKKLGLKRKVDIDDSNTYKKWLSLGFDQKAILAAANAIKGANATINKLDNTILDLYSYKKFTEKEVIDFFSAKKELKDFTIELNKTLGVYVDNLETEINTYIIKWIAKGIEKPLLLSLAELCFLNEKRKLTELDDTVNRMVKLGIFTLEDYSLYANEVAKKDKLVEKMLQFLEQDRKVNNIDRKQYKHFEELGFNEELINYAASISKYKVNYYSYMNAILNNWKSKNIYDIKSAEKISSYSRSFGGDNAKPQEIISHNYTKEQWNAVYTSIEDLTFD